MTSKSFSKNYGSLTPEERFRLILAASGRGDELERDRLARAGKRIALSMEDHAPYAHAFDDLAMMTFLELLDYSARFFDAIAHIQSVHCKNGAVGLAGPQSTGNVPDAAAAELRSAQRAKTEPNGVPEPDGTDGDGTSRDIERDIDRAMAVGYQLRTLANGWKLFCDEMNVPPFIFWKDLPGFNRFRLALALNENAPFGPRQFLQWLNSVRPAGTPEITKTELTAEATASAYKEKFRDRVRWWGGTSTQ
jgi:hypothetical protein